MGRPWACCWLALFIQPLFMLFMQLARSTLLGPQRHACQHVALLFFLWTYALLLAVGLFPAVALPAATALPFAAATGATIAAVATVAAAGSPVIPMR